MLAGGSSIEPILGNRHPELEVHVESPCPQDGDCGSRGKELYTILHNVHGKFEMFLCGCSFSSFSDLPCIRQKLYEIPRLYPCDSKMWNKRLQILCSAQSIMQWLQGYGVYSSLVHLSRLPFRETCLW